MQIWQMRINVYACRCHIHFISLWRIFVGQFLGAKEWSGRWWASCGLAASHAEIHQCPPHPPPIWWAIPKQKSRQLWCCPSTVSSPSLSWDSKSVQVRKLVFQSHLLGFLRWVKSQFWLGIEMFGEFSIFSAWLISLIFCWLIQCP